MPGKNKPGCREVCCDPCVAFEDRFTADPNGPPDSPDWDAGANWSVESERLRYEPNVDCWEVEPGGDSFQVEPGGECWEYDWFSTPEADRRIDWSFADGGGTVEFSGFLPSNGDQIGVTIGTHVVWFSAGEPGYVELEKNGGFGTERYQDDATIAANEWHEFKVCFHWEENDEVQTAYLLEAWVDGVQVLRINTGDGGIGDSLRGFIAGAVDDYLLVDDVEVRWHGSEKVLATHPDCPLCSQYCWLDDCSGGSIDVTLDGFLGSVDGTYTVTSSAADIYGPRWSKSFTSGSDTFTITHYTEPPIGAAGCYTETTVHITSGPNAGYKYWLQLPDGTDANLTDFPITEIAYLREHPTFPPTAGEGATAYIECAGGGS